MKIRIVGLQKKAFESFINKEYPFFEITEGVPEIIISYGGDGTLLYAEREYPGIPKVVIRNSQICNLCSKIVKDTILQLLQKKEYSIIEYKKLEAEVNETKILGLNDIIIGHPHVNGVLRAKVYIDGYRYCEEILGDGIVISTQIGSTGYYQSITRSNFESGIGIAFNNTINIVNHLVLHDKSKIEVEITRGPGVVTADNDERYIQLTTADKILIQMSDNSAKVIKFAEEHRRFNVGTNANRFPLGFCQVCGQHYEK